MPNLSEGQFQIEDLIFGRGTPYKINDEDGFDIQPYGVQAGDYQIPRQDENRFGQDQLTPGPINIKLLLLQNRWIRPGPPGAALVSADLGKLQRIWRADGVRYNWGEMQSLYYGSMDGTTKVIFGRTGKFQYRKIDSKTESHTVVAEFRRADILSYSDYVYTKGVTPNQPAALVTAGTLGDAPSWITLFIQGPLNDWSVEFNGITIESDWDIPAGTILEINSYPWSRRCVDSLGVNRRANLVGATPYLDRLRFRHDASPTVRIVGTGTNGNSYGVLQWRDAFQVIK